MADNLENKGPGQENGQGQDQTLPDRLNGREEDEEVGATSEKKRPREENEEDEAMAEKKRPREENKEDLCIKQT